MPIPKAKAAAKARGIVRKLANTPATQLQDGPSHVAPVKPDNVADEGVIQTEGEKKFRRATEGQQKRTMPAGGRPPVRRKFR